MQKLIFRQREGGAALMVVMIILLLVTLMGLTTMKASTLQEKMAGGNADKALAFQAGELALRDAERHIRLGLTSTAPFQVGCVAGLCHPAEDGTFLGETIDWNSSKVLTYGDWTLAIKVGGVSRQPQYIVELLSDMPAPLGDSVNANRTGTPYRITAIGYGRQPETRVLLQSTFYNP